MARPVTRTEVLDEGEREVMRSAMPTCPFAYREMGLSERGVTYPSFQRAWAGKPVTGRDVRMIRKGWEAWSFRMLQVLREAQKRPVEQAYTPEGSPVVDPFEATAA